MVRGSSRFAAARSRLLVALLGVVGLVIAAVASGQTITEFPLPNPGSGPLGMTAGPDGNLWFTEQFGPGIGRITTAGTITEFTIPTAPATA